MIVQTRSGSTYEIDQGNSKIRRISNPNTPASSFQGDNEWRTYKEIGPIIVGNSIMIVWADSKEIQEANEKRGFSVPGTVTSPVISIS